MKRENFDHVCETLWSEIKLLSVDDVPGFCFLGEEYIARCRKNWSDNKDCHHYLRKIAAIFLRSIICCDRRRIEYLIRTMAFDNGMSLLDESEWHWPDNKKYLEELASRLTDDELHTFACGEYEDIQKIVKKHNVEPLDNFLNDVFDGKLNKDFFE